MGQGHVIRVENHKNDRFLEIRKDGSMAEIREEGYTSIVHNLDEKELKATLRKIIEHEFPRSHKLRIKIRQDEAGGDLSISPWSARKIR